MNKTNLFIVISALALVALVLFQVSWYKHSQGLLEEQFDSTVNMAMCLAVQNVGQCKGKDENEEAEAVTPSCAVGGATLTAESNNTFTGIVEEELDLGALDIALRNALDFYNINLDYEFHILEQNEVVLACGIGPGYCCSLTPFVDRETKALQVLFLGKTPYLMGKMKFQLAACLLIILFITGVFIFANYLLRQQKRIAQSNLDFFNNMAHEFNTPLTNIGLASKLFSKTNTALKEDRYLGIIKNESAKLKQQVERFLHLMKVENGSFQLRLEQINLNELLGEVVADMQLQLIENGGQLRLHASKEILLVEADRFHLGNAFRNLIDNAIKYALDKPEIDVYLKKEVDGVSILFKDAGVGIPLSEQKQVFQKFHRLNAGDLHQQKGFGLGLAYVKAIVEAHQGAIQLFSEIDKGCRFNLELPLKTIS
ncbi:MAG: two-component system phosphate regulon sensor histidine kinase PhoR [Polaribacter sp.]|jgi:two-component system phosphate regulon sensor histidine kinase PhoR